MEKWQSKHSSLESRPFKKIMKKLGWNDEGAGRKRKKNLAMEAKAIDVTPKLIKEEYSDSNIVFKEQMGLLRYKTSKADLIRIFPYNHRT